MKKTASIKSVSDEGALSSLSQTRNLAWINIAMQVVFPLTLSFTPAMAELSAPSEIMDLRGEKLKTVSYRLKAGESAWTVANRYGLSFPALEHLNHGRHFTRGFQAVTEGDEISVPENIPDNDEQVARSVAKPFPERESVSTVAKARQRAHRVKGAAGYP